MIRDQKSFLANPGRDNLRFLLVHSGESEARFDFNSSGMLGEAPELQRECRLPLVCA
jgi:hypothetical protein